MARDDYHVVLYQILSYLYVKLKSGEMVDEKFLKHNSPFLGINESYWKYIIINIFEEGYIKGIKLTKAFGNEIFIDGLENIVITPKGIEYLMDNNFLNKVKHFLKDIKAIVPFV